MNIEEFRNYCLSFPGAEERMPFEKFFHGKHSFLAFYVQGKMFCYFDIDKFDQCTIKCPPEEIGELEATYAAVTRPYNLSPKNWISVSFNQDVPDSKIRELVRQSYDIVAASLTKKQREELDLSVDCRITPGSSVSIPKE